MIMCVKCGESTEIEDTKGSYNHPYCKKCFKKVWNNDYDKYFKWLGETHNV